MKSNFRTSHAKAKGLGSARSGVQHFWMQRLTALANIPLFVFFVILVVSLIGADYRFVLGVLSHPLVALFVSLMIFSGIYHMKLGMQVIIEDYISHKGWRTLVLALNIFFSTAMGAACILAILQIILRGLVNG